MDEQLLELARSLIKIKKLDISEEALALLLKELLKDLL